MISRNKQRRFKITFWRGGDAIEEQVLTATELATFDRSSFSFILEPHLDSYEYVDRDGNRVPCRIEGSGLGETTLDILRALQLEPNVLQTPGDIAVCTGRDYLRDPGVLAARIKVIRAALGESGVNQRFVRSTRSLSYRIGWVEHPWLWIELDESPR